MNVKGATERQIRQAADKVGVRIYNFNDKGKWKRHADGSPCQFIPQSTFSLKTGSASVWDNSGRKPVPRAKYRRFSDRTGHSIPGAVCWHGHRDFLRALFHLAPNATVKTAVAVYRGADNFEATYRATASSPSSWQAATWTQTVSADNACSCVEWNAMQIH